jgi:hypothetical protein
MYECAASANERPLHDADDHAADDVDEHDQQAGDGVAANEFGGAVHGAEEAAFVFQPLTAAARFFFVDEARRKVRIDRHLLAGHGVKVEARSDFSDAPRAFRYDDEVHDDQDCEHDDPDDEVAAHHEIAERSITCPAASVPSWPRDRIRRVEARLSASRSIVAINSTVGKAENSSGVWMNSAVMRINTEKMMEIASEKSSSSGGSGRISTTRMVRTPIASAISPRLKKGANLVEAR